MEYSDAPKLSPKIVQPGDYSQEGCKDNYETLVRSLNKRSFANRFNENKFNEIFNSIRDGRSFESIQDFQQLNYIVSPQGRVSGNHYHDFKREDICVLDGCLEVILKDLAGRTRVSEKARSGEIVTLEPGIYHSLRAVEETRFLEISNMAFDPEDGMKDVYKLEMLAEN